MRFFRASVALALLSVLTGCGYVHLGRQPAATATGDGSTSEAYTNLATEHKILKQELAIARQEGDALRAAVDRGSAAASPELLAQLTATSRELATLRANYAKLQGTRTGSSSALAAGGAAQVSDLEEKLAASLRNYTQLQAENGRLRADIDRTHTENSALTTKLKTATGENEQAQATLAQLNTELIAQKEARARAEQATAAAHAQLGAVMARRESAEPAAGAAVASTPPSAGDVSSSAASALALAKAPSADSSAVAELRTNPDRLRAAPSPRPGQTVRIHVVEAGDTLEQLAEKYLGDSSGWIRIYTANNDLLRDGRPLQVGMKLEIPEK